MRKLLVTGASGMLGSALVQLFHQKYTVYATARRAIPGKPKVNFRQFDLNTAQYRDLKNWVKPDVIIHCAAITSHEYCASHPKEAMEVNGDSVKKLIDSYPNTKLIFISTDAVFPLHSHLASETTKTGPATIYGKSKELGEKYCLRMASNGCIVRTTIVGGSTGGERLSFAEWIISSLKNGKKITLYGDTVFTPISIWNLADELEWVINHDVPSILHIAGREIVSKYDFGHSLCNELKLDARLITKGQMGKGIKIQRSQDQSLDVSLYQSISGHRLPDVKDTIRVMVKHFTS